MPLPSVTSKSGANLPSFPGRNYRLSESPIPLMTPSAARGVLDAILYKPQMRWHVRRISVLRPVTLPAGFPESEAQAHYRLTSIRRNEIQGTIAPRTVQGWMDNPESFEPYLVDSAGRDGPQGQNRTQRNSLVLHHVAYRIDASPKLTEKRQSAAPFPRTTKTMGRTRWPNTSRFSSAAWLRDNVSIGPTLAFGNSPATSRRPTTDEQPVAWTESFGFMLYDIRFQSDGTKRPGFFNAKATNGVLHCDAEDGGPNGEPPITVHGWSDLEGTE